MKRDRLRFILFFVLVPMILAGLLGVTMWQRSNNSDGEVLVKAKVIGAVWDKYSNHNVQVLVGAKKVKIHLSQQDFESLKPIPSETNPIVVDIRTNKYLFDWLGIKGKITKVY